MPAGFTQQDQMSFLNWPTEEKLSSRRSHHHRRQVMADLFRTFSEAFPDVTYELLWDSPSINAQAWRLGSARLVRVYGGLVRHPAMTKYGLTLMLAHEAGHHLGGEPRDPAMPWMTWQGQADYWAARVAMPRIWGTRSRGATLRAAREILKLHRLLDNRFPDEDEPDLSPECRFAIFQSGAFGLDMPRCAVEAFACISDDFRSLHE